VQALAFLPNEIWIHAGDSITWTFPVSEPHTVTFLTPGPPAQVARRIIRHPILEYRLGPKLLMPCVNFYVPMAGLAQIAGISR
jgi:hypothetical protein